MIWTDDKVELLKKLWGEKKSTLQIAAKLGVGFTKNSVIGKAHRLGLEARKSPIPKRVVRVFPDRCQWPIGHPGEPGFHFCQAHRAFNRPYCPIHCAKAYKLPNRRMKPEEFERRA